MAMTTRRTRSTATASTIHVFDASVGHPNTKHAVNYKRPQKPQSPPKGPHNSEVPRFHHRPLPPSTTSNQPTHTLPLPAPQPSISHTMSWGLSFDFSSSMKLNLVRPAPSHTQTRGRKRKTPIRFSEALESARATKEMYDCANRALKRVKLDVPLQLGNDFDFNANDIVSRSTVRSHPKYANWLLQSRNGVTSRIVKVTNRRWPGIGDGVGKSPVSNGILDRTRCPESSRGSNSSSSSSSSSNGENDSNGTGTTVDMIRKHFSTTTPIFKDWPSIKNNDSLIHRFCSELTRGARVSVDEHARLQVHVGLGGRALPSLTIRKLVTLVWVTEELIYQLCPPSHRPGFSAGSVNTTDGPTPLLSLRRDSPLNALENKDIQEFLMMRLDFIQRQQAGYMPPGALALAKTNTLLARVVAIWGLEDHELLERTYGRDTLAGSMDRDGSQHDGTRKCKVNLDKVFAIEPCCPGFSPGSKSRGKVSQAPQTIAFRCMAGTLDSHLAVRWARLCFAILEKCSSHEPEVKKDPFPAVIGKVLQGFCVNQDYSILDFLKDLGLGYDIAAWRAQMANYPQTVGNINTQSNKVAVTVAVASSIKPNGPSSPETADITDADAPETSVASCSRNSDEHLKGRSKHQPIPRKSLVVTLPTPPPHWLRAMPQPSSPLTESGEFLDSGGTSDEFLDSSNDSDR